MLHNQQFLHEDGIRMPVVEKVGGCEVDMLTPKPIFCFQCIGRQTPFTSSDLDIASYTLRSLNWFQKSVSFSDVLRMQLEGDSGELAQMETKESVYTAAITQSLNNITYNSIRMVGEHLAWGVVLGFSIGTGRIEFAAAAAPTVTYLIKKRQILRLKQQAKPERHVQKMNLRK